MISKFWSIIMTYQDKQHSDYLKRTMDKEWNGLIKLLIIDDETTTRKGLVKYIDWKAMGIETIKEAKDGIEGLEIAFSFRPDIILSDIRMPGMNGIELATCIKEQIPNCKLIFLSGYSDKEYLKAAIHLNAISYIEKPINLAEVKEVIKKAVDQCLEEGEKRLAEEKMIKALSESLPLIKKKIVTSLINLPAAPDDLQKDINLVGAHFESCDRYTVVIVQLVLPRQQTNVENLATGGKILQLMDNSLHDIEHVCAFEDQQHIIAILSGAAAYNRRRLQTILESLHAQIKENDFSCNNLFFSVGQTVLGMDRIWQSYQKALIFLQKLVFLGYGPIVFYEDKSDEPNCWSDDISSQLRDLLQIQHKVEAFRFIENLCREISFHKDIRVDEVKNIFFKLADVLAHEAERRGVNFDEAGEFHKNYLWAQIYGFQTLQEIKKYLLDEMIHLFDGIEEMESNSKSVFYVMKYIQKHYTTYDLSNKTLADYVHLTPTYLSWLFKKETGKTLGEYVIEVRIEKSKELLRESHIKLFEVARKVGYSDANYYAKVFKKQTGLTPSKFRVKYKL